MTFYHGCTKEAFDICRKKGFLLHDRKGVHYFSNGKKIFTPVSRYSSWYPENHPDPVLYLTPDKDKAQDYGKGEVLLKVLYDPDLHIDYNNYCGGSWQFRVYEKIDWNDIFMWKDNEWKCVGDL